MLVRSVFTCGVVILGITCGRAPAQTAPAADGGDPVQFFNLLSKGKDYVDRAELSGLQLSIFDRIASRLGASKSRISRGDFMKVHESRLAELRQSRERLSGSSVAPGVPATTSRTRRSAPPTESPDTDAERPTVDRAGKLSPELPAWFFQLDTDGDGQVGLYEWVKGGRPVEEFRKIDRNGDGFLTAAEVLRYIRLHEPAGRRPGERPG
jgi:hypothetical protein